MKGHVELMEKLQRDHSEINHERFKREKEGEYKNVSRIKTHLLQTFHH